MKEEFKVYHVSEKSPSECEICNKEFKKNEIEKLIKEKAGCKKVVITDKAYEEYFDGKKRKD